MQRWIVSLACGIAVSGAFYLLLQPKGYRCFMKPDGSVYCSDPRDGRLFRLRADRFRVTVPGGR